MLEMHDKNAGRVAISNLIHEFHLEEDKGRQLDKERRQMRGDHLSFDLNFTHILSLGSLISLPSQTYLQCHPFIEV